MFVILHISRTSFGDFGKIKYYFQYLLFMFYKLLCFYNLLKYV